MSLEDANSFLHSAETRVRDASRELARMRRAVAMIGAELEDERRAAALARNRLKVLERERDFYIATFTRLRALVPRLLTTIAFRELDRLGMDFAAGDNTPESAVENLAIRGDVLALDHFAPDCGE